MSLDAFLIFAGFWAQFATPPGPNAVNCVQNGLALGFVRAIPGIAAILTQATVFLLSSAAGVTALTLTTLSYCGDTALGAGMGRRALSAMANLWLRRGLAGCFVLYGIALALT